MLDGCEDTVIPVFQDADLASGRVIGFCHSCGGWDMVKTRFL